MEKILHSGASMGMSACACVRNTPFHRTQCTLGASFEITLKPIRLFRLKYTRVEYYSFFFLIFRSLQPATCFVLITLMLQIGLTVYVSFFYFLFGYCHVHM